MRIDGLEPKPLGFGADGGQGTADDSAVPAGAFTETFAYNGLDQQTLHVSFEGVVSQSLYDAAGRMAEQRFFDNLTSYNGGAGAPTEVWTYKHDASGREVEARQTRGANVRVVTKTYDGEGRLIVQSSPEGIVNYEYDDLGRKTRTYTGTTANPISDYRYTYDALGRLATVEARERNDVTLTPAETTSCEYDLVGNLDLQRQANGTIVDYVFDSLNRLDTLTQYAPDGTPNDLSDNPKIADFDYTVRADGKRTAVTERIWKDGANQSPMTNQFTWDYDAIGRLILETLDSSDNTLDNATTYKFDLAGNRLEKEVDQGSNNTIDQFFAYAYDANDRLLTESFDNGMDAIIEQITTYGWGASNLGTQQTSKTVHDQATNLDTLRVSYAYDLQGRMEVVTTETLALGLVTRREKMRFGNRWISTIATALNLVPAVPNRVRPANTGRRAPAGSANKKSGTLARFVENGDLRLRRRGGGARLGGGPGGLPAVGEQFGQRFGSAFGWQRRQRTVAASRSARVRRHAKKFGSNSPCRRQNARTDKPL